MYWAILTRPNRYPNSRPARPGSPVKSPLFLGEAAKQRAERLRTGRPQRNAAFVIPSKIPAKLASQVRSAKTGPGSDPIRSQGFRCAGARSAESPNLSGFAAALIGGIMAACPLPSTARKRSRLLARMRLRFSLAICLVVTPTFSQRSATSVGRLSSRKNHNFPTTCELLPRKPRS